jgi:hypothetical protein
VVDAASFRRRVPNFPRRDDTPVTQQQGASSSCSVPSRRQASTLDTRIAANGLVRACLTIRAMYMHLHPVLLLHRSTS